MIQIIKKMIQTIRELWLDIIKVIGLYFIYLILLTGIIALCNWGQERMVMILPIVFILITMAIQINENQINENQNNN